MTKVTLLRLLICGTAAAVIMHASTAGAVIVQYDGTLGMGWGDFGPGDPQNNALPPCKATGPGITGSTTGTQMLPIGSATTAMIDFMGVASVMPGSFPQSVKFFPHTPWNGLETTCNIVATEFGPSLTRRTTFVTFSWPASGGTVSNGGGFGGPASAPFQFAPVWAPTGQAVQAIAQPATISHPGSRFGGAVALAGQANFLVGIKFGAVTTYVGSVPIPVFMGVEGGTATPTAILSATEMWYLKTSLGTPTDPPVATIPLLAQHAGFRWTTGQVFAFDTRGDFSTTRTRTGTDQRTPNGTHGVLQLVSPAVMALSGLAPGGFAVTATLELNFVPEPASSSLLAGGVLLLVGLHTVRRRQL
jgi:hypothetical protein